MSDRTKAMVSPEDDRNVGVTMVTGWDMEAEPRPIADMAIEVV